MKIPSQNNIAEIFESAIKYTDDFLIKVDTLIKSTNQHLIQNTEDIKQLKSGFKNTINAIKVISSMLLDAHNAMFELEYTVKTLNVSMVLENPLSIIKFLKKGNIQDDENNNPLFLRLFQILKLSKIFAEYGESIKIKNIKKVKKIVIKTIKTIEDIYNSIISKFAKSKLLILMNPILESIDKSIEVIIDILGGMLSKIKNFVENNSVDKKQIKELVSSIFYIQNRLLIELVKFTIKLKIANPKKLMQNLLPFLLITGTMGLIFKSLIPVIEQLNILGNNSRIIKRGLKVLSLLFDKKQNGKGIIKYKSLINIFTSYTKRELTTIGKKLLLFESCIAIPLFSIFKSTENVISGLASIGEKFIKINIALKAVKTLFGKRDKNNKSSLLGNNIYLLEELTKVNKSDIKKLSIALAVSFMYSLIFTALSNVFNVLIQVGSKYIDIYRGIKVTNLIFNNVDGNLFKQSRKSLLNILINIKDKDLLKLKNAVIASVCISTIMSILMIVFNILTFVGSNSRKIKRGIKVTNLIFNNVDGNLFKQSRKSLLSILSSVSGEDIKNLTTAIKVTTLITIIMTMFFGVFNILFYAGDNSRKIKRGIRVLRFIVFKLYDIIKFLNSYDNNELKEVIKKIGYLSISLIKFGAALLILSIAGLLALNAIIAVSAIIIIIGLYIVIVKIIRSNFKNTQELEENSIQLAIIGLSLCVFAEVFEMISSMEGKIDFICIVSVLFLSLLTILTFSLASEILENISIKGVLLLIPIALSVLSMAYALSVISKLEIDYEKILDFVISLTIILGVTLLLALVAIALPIAIAGTLLLTIEMTMLIILAVEIILLSKIKLNDIEKAKNNIKAIFDVSKVIIDYFLRSIVDFNPEGDAWYTTAVKAVFGPLGALVTALVAMAFIAITLITITMVLVIAAELRLIQEINLDKSKILSTVNDIFEIVTFITSFLFGGSKSNTPSEEDSSIWSSLLTYVFAPIGSLIKAIFALAYVAMAVITVSCVLFIATELRLIQEINLDKKAIITVVDKVLSSIDYINSKISKNREKPKNADAPWYKKALRQIPIFSHLSDLMDAISNMGTVAMSMITVGMISLIATNLKLIQDIELNDKTIKAKTNNILAICEQLNTQLNDEKKLSFDEEKIELFGNYTSHLSDFIKSINKLDDKKVQPFIKIIDKANSINTDKIKSIRDMFEQIARFSESIKGNFDKLADVLSEKLVDVLANINETIGNINSNKSGNNISNISSNNAVNTNTSAQETKRNIEQMNKLVSIADSLEDILSVLKEVRENTDYQYKI